MDKKQLKISKESLQLSISKTESALTMAISEGNKRASDSAARVLKCLQIKLEALKGAK
jgi:hypothetical protein